jgi:DNA-binding NtrC family response regulator
MLPDGLADELLEELARRASAPPTVMVSASPAAPEVARSYGIAFVAKPFDIDGLLMAIQRAIAAEKKPSHPPPSR